MVYIYHSLCLVIIYLLLAHASSPPSVLFFFSFFAPFFLFCILTLLSVSLVPHQPPTLTPHLSLCWGGCNCCDFDKVFSTCISAYVWMQGVCVFLFFLVCKCVRLLRTQRPSVCVSLLQRARTYVCRCCCLCHATVLCSVLRYPLTFFITCSLVHLVSAYVIPPHLPLLVPSLMFAPSSLSLIDSEAYVTGILRS